MNAKPMQSKQRALQEAKRNRPTAVVQCGDLFYFDAVVTLPRGAMWKRKLLKAFVSPSTPSVGNMDRGPPSDSYSDL